MCDGYRTLLFPVILFLLLAIMAPLPVQAAPKIDHSTLVADRHGHHRSSFVWGGGYSRGWEPRRVVRPVYYDYYPAYYYPGYYYYYDPYYYNHPTSGFYLNFRIN